MASTKERMQLLDSFRAIAILAVFLFHCVGTSFGYDHLPWGHWSSEFTTRRSFLVILPFTFGWAGVAIFFVVSGFCIHLSYLKGAANDWRSFFVRRFFRIYPPYLLALIFFAWILPTTRILFHSRFGQAQFGSHVLLLHNLDQRSFFGINPAFWSIAVEVQLYLIYPVLLALVRRIGWHRALIVLGTLEILMRGIIGVIETVSGNAVPRWFSGSPFCYWYSWAIGAALADAFIRKNPLPFRSLSTLALSVLAVCTYFVTPLASFSFLFFALLGANVIARLLIAESSVSFPHSSVVHLRNLGMYSYSFYLLHQPFIAMTSRLLAKLQAMPHHPLVTFAICAATYPFIYLLSRLYYRFVEVPNIAIGRRVLQRAPVAALKSTSTAD